MENIMFEFFTGLVRYLRESKRGLSHLRTFHFSLVPSIWKQFKASEKTLALLCAMGLLFGLYQNFVIARMLVTLPAPAAGGSLSEGLVGQPHFINPIFATSSTDTALVQLVYAGLYKFDNQGQIVPDMATEMPEISDNQKEYTVHLKQNVKWHDGTSFNADDVIFTIKSIQEPDIASPLKNTWLTTVVEKKDDFTVVFKTENITAPFLANLTLPIISYKLWQKIDPKNYSVSQLNLENAIGTGPYYIKEITKQDDRGKISKITLESFASFYDSAPLITELSTMFYDTSADARYALTSKEVDAFGSVSFEQTARNLDSPHDTFFPMTNQAQVVFLNLTGGPMTDKALRQAFSLTVDRDAIISSVYGGEAKSLNTPIFPSQLKDLPQATNPNLDAAKKLLADAGYRLAADGKLHGKNGPVTVRVVTTKNNIYQQTVEELKKTWEPLGVTVNVGTIDSKEVREKIIKTRDFDAFLYSYKLDSDPDLFAFWHSSQSKDPGLNISGYTSTAADKLIIEARALLDPAARTKKYQDFISIFSADVPAIILNQSEFVYKIDKRVKNVNLGVLYDSKDRFYDLRNWYIAEQRVWKWGKQ